MCTPTRIPVSMVSDKGVAIVVCTDGSQWGLVDGEWKERAPVPGSPRHIFQRMASTVDSKGQGR